MTAKPDTVPSDPGDAPLKHVFGPVTSRRLGESLGIDPVPLKTCNWNCVYCQLGRTVPLQNKRAEYVPVEAVLREVETALSSNRTGGIDWVTFVGSGETLLHSKIGDLVRGVGNLTDIPVAVITNGSLLAYPEIREELLPADAVLPTLDAGTPELFRRINRPHPSISFKEHLRGLEAFAREYKGKLLLEVMLVKGLNDSENALSDIAECLKRIRPQEVHVSLPDRPPAEPWVSPPDAHGLMRASAILGSSAHVLHPLVSVISLGSIESALETILGVVGRHPLSEDQLLRALSKWPEEEKTQLLKELEEARSTVQIRRHGTLFWVAASGRFPNH